MFEATSVTKSYTVCAIEVEGKWKTKELDLTKCYRECGAICSLLKVEMLTGSFFFFYIYIFFSLSLLSIMSFSLYGALPPSKSDKAVADSTKKETSSSQLSSLYSSLPAPESGSTVFKSNPQQPSSESTTKATVAAATTATASTANAPPPNKPAGK